MCLEWRVPLYVFGMEGPPVCVWNGGSLYVFGMEGPPVGVWCTVLFNAKIFSLPGSRLGRVQPFLPQLLHEAVDHAEQPMPPVPAGVDCTSLWKLAGSSLLPVVEECMLVKEILKCILHFFFFSVLHPCAVNTIKFIDLLQN